MKKVVLKSALILGVILSVVSCKKEEKKDAHVDYKKERKHKSDDEKTKEVNGIEITEYHVLSEEDQKKLTPDMVLQQLAAGNERFRTGEVTARDHSPRSHPARRGRNPTDPPGCRCDPSADAASDRQTSGRAAGTAAAGQTPDNPAA